MSNAKKLNILKLNYRLALMLIIIGINFNSVSAQNLTIKQKDSAFLINSKKERVEKIKKSLAKTFINFTDNDISLYGSLDLSKQIINDNSITAPLNYIYNSINSNTYQGGYSGGFRIDGIYKEKHFYTLSFALNRITVGNYYKNKHTLSPFFEEFTHFKADNAFTTLSIAAHYKKLLPFNSLDKYKFYIILGPSFNYKISRISNENLINGAGNRSIINGDFGAEFDNKGYYILFAHYKLGVNMTSSTVPVQLNRFEIGMSIKAKDLF
jgi:hypothetical protein